MTCLAFAVKLVGRDIEITNCDPLFSEKYQEKCKVLLELLQAAGYEVPRQPIWRIDPDSYEYLMKNTYETMILQEYSLKMVLSDCNPSSQKVNAIAEFSEDIGEVLPYLNTVLRGIQYNETEKVLVVKKEGRLITFRPRQIALTKLEDENEARTVMEGLKQILNETYANKDHIKPTYISRPIPRPLDIFKLLPGKNCKECGQPTCMAFALKLVNDEVEWKQCPLILTKELERNRLKLMGILSDSEE
jgi:ArsR family metal-binding transcriptional regulator